MSATLDHFVGGCFTTARQCIDLGASRNLRRCLAIYPHVPLPSCAFHAPIVPRYPSLTEVTELVTLECHQGAFFQPYFQEPSPPNSSLDHRSALYWTSVLFSLPIKVDIHCCAEQAFDRPNDTQLRSTRESTQLAGVLSFVCVSQFLESCGTVLQKNSSLELTAARRQNLLAALQREASLGGTTRRSGHGHGRTVQFARRAPDRSREIADPQGGRSQVFLNEQHFRLARGLEWFSTTAHSGLAAPIDPETKSKFLLQKEHGSPLIAALYCWT